MPNNDTERSRFNFKLHLNAWEVYSIPLIVDYLPACLVIITFMAFPSQAVFYECFVLPPHGIFASVLPVSLLLLGNISPTLFFVLQSHYRISIYQQGKGEMVRIVYTNLKQKSLDITLQCHVLNEARYEHKETNILITKKVTFTG